MIVTSATRKSNEEENEDGKRLQRKKGAVGGQSAGEVRLQPEKEKKRQRGWLMNYADGRMGCILRYYDRMHGTSPSALFFIPYVFLRLDSISLSVLTSSHTKTAFRNSRFAYGVRNLPSCSPFFSSLHQRLRNRPPPSYSVMYRSTTLTVDSLGREKSFNTSWSPTESTPRYMYAGFRPLISREDAGSEPTNQRTLLMPSHDGTHVMAQMRLAAGSERTRTNLEWSAGGLASSLVRFTIVMIGGIDDGQRA